MPCIQIIQSEILSFNFFLWVIITIYFLIIIVSWYGWQKTDICDIGLITEPVLVSIIVAIRNEDKNIPYLLSDLEHQTYPGLLTEWIFIDDHSVNKLTGLKEFETILHKNHVIIELDTNQNGKKAALSIGAERSKGELLIFTDADCRIKPQWIKSIVNQYINNNPAMIIGLVDYHNYDGFLRQFYRLDLISLVITGAGLASVGFPVMCNGANIAVRRDIYLKNSKLLRPEIASGDDVFMLHSIKKDIKEKLLVMKSEESIVTTNSPASLSEFLNQRTRWASKSWTYTDKSSVFLSIIVLLANLALIGRLVDAIFNGGVLNLIYLFLIKVTADCFIITAGLNFFGGIRNVLLFPVFSVIYPFYILYVFILSIIGTFTWKGRVVKN